jgi:predicted ATPase
LWAVFPTGRQASAKARTFAAFNEDRLAGELMRRQHKGAEARAVLGPVYGRFTEGLAAPKMKQAKALLDQLP